MLLLTVLTTNEQLIRARSEEKAQALAGGHPASKARASGLSIFFNQLLQVVAHPHAGEAHRERGKDAIVQVATDGEEPAILASASRPYDVEIAKCAGVLGMELHRLGCTISHVVHAYGAMSQAIMEIAIEQNAAIKTEEFLVLNRCFDTAIGSAMMGFHAEVEEVTSRETQNLGMLAHELRNALVVVNTSLDLIKSGTVGFSGSVGRVMDRALKRQQELIDLSLVELRLRADPEVHKEHVSFFQLIDHVLISADAEARVKSQAFDVEIEPGLRIEADQYLLFSAVSILLQNAIKYTSTGGVIRIRAHDSGNMAVIEIEDQRGGVGPASSSGLFQSFEQRYKNHVEAGPALTVARRAVELNDGTLDVKSLPGTGCIFRIHLPRIRFLQETVRTHPVTV